MNRGWRFCRPLPYHLATAPIRVRLFDVDKSKRQMERETGFEPATSTLARSHSTTELLPLARPTQSTVPHAFGRIKTGPSRSQRPSDDGPASRETPPFARRPTGTTRHRQSGPRAAQAEEPRVVHLNQSHLNPQRPVQLAGNLLSHNAPRNRFYYRTIMEPSR